MRLRSKTADLLRTPKFEEYMNEAYSDKITNAIRELFPDYKIESNQRHNVSIITIKGKDGKDKEVLQWNSNDQGFLGESRGEKDKIDEAIRSVGLKQIWPSVQEATKKVKQRYGVD